MLVASAAATVFRVIISLVFLVAVAAAANGGGSSPVSIPIRDPALSKRFNYASFDCGALILAHNDGASQPTAILHSSRDSYMLSRCAADRFVVVELCDDILIDRIAIANYEYFSSTFRDFDVYVSDKYPPSARSGGWAFVGTFRADNVKHSQVFPVRNPRVWARYIRVVFLSQYGSEFYCPLSSLRVYGKTMMEEVKAAASESVDDQSLNNDHDSYGNSDQSTSHKQQHQQQKQQQGDSSSDNTHGDESSGIQGKDGESDSIGEGTTGQRSESISKENVGNSKRGDYFETDKYDGYSSDRPLGDYNNPSRGEPMDFEAILEQYHSDFLGPDYKRMETQPTFNNPDFSRSSQQSSTKDINSFSSTILETSTSLVNDTATTTTMIRPDTQNNDNSSSTSIPHSISQTNESISDGNHFASNSLDANQSSAFNNDNTFSPSHTTNIINETQVITASIKSTSIVNATKISKSLDSNSTMIPESTKSSMDNVKNNVDSSINWQSINETMSVTSVINDTTIVNTSETKVPSSISNDNVNTTINDIDSSNQSSNVTSVETNSTVVSTTTDTNSKETDSKITNEQINDELVDNVEYKNVEAEPTKKKQRQVTDFVLGPLTDDLPGRVRPQENIFKTLLHRIGYLERSLINIYKALEKQRDAITASETASEKIASTTVVNLLNEYNRTIFELFDEMRNEYSIMRRQVESRQRLTGLQISQLVGLVNNLRVLVVVMLLVLTVYATVYFLIKPAVSPVIQGRRAPQLQRGTSAPSLANANSNNNDYADSYSAADQGQTSGNVVSRQPSKPSLRQTDSFSNLSEAFEIKNSPFGRSSVTLFPDIVDQLGEQNNVLINGNIRPTGSRHQFSESQSSLAGIQLVDDDSQHVSNNNNGDSLLVVDQSGLASKSHINADNNNAELYQGSRQTSPSQSSAISIGSTFRGLLGTILPLSRSGSPNVTPRSSAHSSPTQFVTVDDSAMIIDPHKRNVIESGTRSQSSEPSIRMRPPSAGEIGNSNYSSLLDNSKQTKLNSSTDHQVPSMETKNVNSMIRKNLPPNKHPSPKKGKLPNSPLGGPIPKKSQRPLGKLNEVQLRSQQIFGNNVPTSTGKISMEITTSTTTETTTRTRTGSKDTPMTDIIASPTTSDGGHESSDDDNDEQFKSPLGNNIPKEFSE